MPEYETIRNLVLESMHECPNQNCHKYTLEDVTQMIIHIQLVLHQNNLPMVKYRVPQEKPAEGASL